MGTERLSNLLKVTQLLSNTAGIRTSQGAPKSRLLTTASLSTPGDVDRDLRPGIRRFGLSSDSKTSCLSDPEQITSSL